MSCLQKAPERGSPGRQFGPREPGTTGRTLMSDDAAPTPGGTRKPKDSRLGRETPPAFQQLRRLIGVTLPEQEAQVVLQSIHEFKWLEAERAGFDVWATIQPDCPLRAAAVHW